MQLCNPIGYVHSLETFGSVDGPGVRFVVFLQGCALRCKYCHNPETWAEGGEEWTVDKLFQRVWRYRNYWGKKGGITVSGGEPLRQLDFLTEFFTLARAKGVHTALEIKEVAEPYIRARAIRHLEKGRVVLFGCGIGSPFFSTDTAAVLRAAEINADVILLAKNIDGVYNADPAKDANAIKYDAISYEDVLAQHLAVMDSTATSLSMDNHIPVLVFALKDPENIIRAVEGEKIGTIVGEN